MRTHILFPCLALAFTAARAQEIVPPPAPQSAPQTLDEPQIALEDLIRRAQNAHPRLTVARENLEATRQRAVSTRILSGPRLQLVPAIGGTREARDEEIILAQPLDVFGVRRARSRVADAQTRRAEAELLWAERTIITDVKHAAAQLFAAQEAEKLEQVQVEIAQLFRDAAAKRAALGDVPLVQVQRAELEFLRSQNELARVRADRFNRRSSLNLLIGQQPDAPLSVALPLDATLLEPLRASSATGSNLSISPSPATSQASSDALLTPAASTWSNRPDLLSAQATLEARQAELQVLAGERRPAVELQARRSAVFGRDGSTALRAVITVPLFDLGANKTQRRAAQAEIRAGEATLRSLNQQVAAQVASAQHHLRTRRETVARYREQMLPLTLDLLRKTQIGYVQGASTYLEVLEAQRTLRQLQSEYLQALVGIQTDEAALDAALNGGGFNFAAGGDTR